MKGVKSLVKIDLNCDIGEGYGRYNFGNDAEIMKYVSSINVACGFHAGDPVTMNRTVELALNAGVSIGAHPGLPDLMGFGRRAMNISFEEAKAYTIYQIGALKAFVESMGGQLHHVKPHGALYNMAATDELLSRALAEAVYAVDKNLVYIGLSGSKMVQIAENVGLKTAHEVFADRAYTAQGTLVSRDIEGAVLHDIDHVMHHVLRMVNDGKVLTMEGQELNIKANTVCVHGDNDKAIQLIKKLKSELENNHISICAF